MTKASKEGQRKAPILRFKGFTDAWEQRKLLKVCKKEDNKRIPIKEQERKEGNTPYFGANGIQGYIDGYTHDGTNILIAEDGANNVKNYPIKLITGKIWVNNHAHVLNVNTKTNNGNFLVGAIKKINFYRYLVGSSRYKLTAESLSQVKIEITEQSEQEKIGELFKSIEELLTLYEKKKQLLTQLKQGIVNFLITKNGPKPQLRFSGFNNNWESKSFEKLLNYEQPTKYIVKKADYISQGTPVLTANKSFVLGYTNETNVYQNIPAIIFDDFTLESKYVDFPFMVKSSAIKILTSENSNLFFIYQLLNNQRFVQEGHSRHYISVVQKKKVLVPSIQEQNKISDLIKQLEDNIELNSNTIVLLKKLKEFLLQSMFL